jgi:ADP-heptose:LPS heptosyltransferase
MEKPLESDVTSIVIKLPFDLQERILSFPLLHAISEYYPKSEIHFITPKKNIEVLNLLPFRAYYHEFDEDEIQNVLDVHRYCVNSKIPNVDVFIGLTNSFSDACLGLALRAKKRVGFADNWKTLVLNKKLLRPVGHHVVEDFLSLFKELTGEESNKKLKIISRDLNRIILEEDPYIAINLSPLRNAKIEDEWFELINQFEGQKIVLFASDEQVRMQMLTESFIEKLPKKNTYVNFTYRDWIELARMLAYANGIITFSGPLGALGAYVGSKTLILYENEDPQKTGPFYFLGEVSVMGTNNPTLVNSTKDGKVLQDRITFNMNEVADKATEFFRL